METALSQESITFGKYKGKSLGELLKDRSYCVWLLKQDWFRTSYEYLHNRLSDYKPSDLFLADVEVQDTPDFCNSYKYFNLKKTDDMMILQNDVERSSYKFYKKVIKMLKNRIQERKDGGEDNIYNIKAPSNWLKEFEEKYGIERKYFKDFLYTYDLPNIPYIVEDIKAEGGIEYKGASSFKIAKERSEKQENWWEGKLKLKHGEDICKQFKFCNCIFDFINIKSNTIYECKLNLKDFNDEQYAKYKVVLNNFKILYLVNNDCILDLENNIIYTPTVSKYEDHKVKVALYRNKTWFDIRIMSVTVIEVFDLTEKI